MLDDNGFRRPTYDDLVDQYATKWRQLFGANARTASNSVGGILIRVQAYFANQLYQLAESVYNSQFVDSATGTTLDQLAANVAISRRSASTAIGSVKIVGKAGYTVEEGTTFQTADGLNYVTSEPITLQDTGSKTYQNGESTVTLEDNIGIGTSDLLYAENSGEKYNKAVETTADQLTPVEEIIAVTVSGITGGADIEDDETLRQRIELANQVVPSSPYNGVIAGINQVSGVRAVRVVANNSMQDDAASNTPAKTVHIYVDGGEKSKIGEAIFDTLAAGVSTCGAQTVTLTDNAGVEHDVKFDYPTRKPVYIKIKLTKNEAYPTDGDDQIKQALVTYVNGVGMGNTIYYSYIYKLIYDGVPGITVADVKIGTTASGVAAQDLTMTNIEAGELTADRVVLE